MGSDGSLRVQRTLSGDRVCNNCGKVDMNVQRHTSGYYYCDKCMAAYRDRHGQHRSDTGKVDKSHSRTSSQSRTLSTEFLGIFIVYIPINFYSYLSIDILIISCVVTAIPNESSSSSSFLSMQYM